MSFFRPPRGLLVLMALTMLSAVPATTDAQRSARPWMQYATPEDGGFSTTLLDRARRYADSARSGAVMVVHRGLVVAAWGDVSRKLELHSVRKSLVSAMFGMAADRGAVDLNRTLKDAGIDDRIPLTPAEQGARIRDLLAARSGVYLPSAYAGREQDEERPARGSQAPGAFFFYNNWDFNVAGVLYERLVEPDLYAAFNRRIAEPLGMEDFTPADGFKVCEPSGSVHPAHTFRMSTRDLARFGQLYLQRGTWDGRSLVSARWVQASTNANSDLGEGAGYGYLRWTYAKGALGRAIRSSTRATCTPRGERAGSSFWSCPRKKSCSSTVATPTTGAKCSGINARIGRQDVVAKRR